MAQIKPGILIVFILTLFVQCKVIEANPVIVAYDVVSGIIGLVTGTISLIDYIKNYNVQDESTKKDFDNQLKIISIKNDLYAIRRENELRELRETIAVITRIERITQNVNMIEILFNDFAELRQNFSKSVPRNRFPNVTYDEYVERIFLGNIQGVAELTDQITDIIEPRTNAFDITNVSVLGSKIKASSFCTTKLSEIQMLSQLFGHLIIVEVKTLMMLLFGYDIKEWRQNDDFSAERRRDQNKSLRRYNRILTKVKTYMSTLSNQIYACEPERHIKDKTYLELERLYQSYIVQELDIYNDNTDTCKNDCSALTYKKVHRCSRYEDVMWKTMCQDTRKCNSRLLDCTFINRKEFHPRIAEVCISKESKSTRRYDFVKFRDNDTRPCNGELHITKTTADTTSFYVPECAYCHCTCEDHNSSGYNYKINLMDSLSDFDKNYVITGVRFVKEADVISIQIQQGKLMPYATIDSRTVQWKELRTERRLAINISYIGRTIDLNTLKAPKDHVIVGLRFADVEDDKRHVHFKLEASYKKFNFTSGELKKYKEPWLYSSQKVQHLSLEDKDSPIRTYDNVLDSKEGQCVMFQPSSLEKDGGQSTIPFIDIQNVTSAVPTPLSGVGLIHRGSATSGGFLGLAILTYNITPHLQEIDVDKQELLRVVEIDNSSH